MISFDEELEKIFGDKYKGCTQAGDELVEYRLKPGETATPGELAQVDALPKGLRLELDEVRAVLFGTETMPPLCTHWAVIDSFDIGQVKPMRVRRTWKGVEYTVNCYVTDGIKDQYQAGDIAVGDYVLVEFLEDDADKAIVFAKVFKTW